MQTKERDANSKTRISRPDYLDSGSQRDVTRKVSKSFLRARRSCPNLREKRECLTKRFQWSLFALFSSAKQLRLVRAKGPPTTLKATVSEGFSCGEYETRPLKASSHQVEFSPEKCNAFTE